MHASTPLHHRLETEKRLLEDSPEVAACPWDTNIIPARLERTALLDGLRSLCNALYRPDAFATRTIEMIERLAPHPLYKAGASRSPRAVETEALLVTKRLTRLGELESRMLRAVLRALGRRPHAGRAAMTALYRYAQVRCMYETGSYWDPHLPAPDIRTNGTGAEGTVRVAPHRLHFHELAARTSRPSPSAEG